MDTNIFTFCSYGLFLILFFQHYSATTIYLLTIFAYNFAAIKTSISCRLRSRVMWCSLHHGNRAANKGGCSVW